MSTLIKHKLLCVTWLILPKAAKGVLYRAHRAKVARKLAHGRMYE